MRNREHDTNGKRPVWSTSKIKTFLIRLSEFPRRYSLVVLFLIGTSWAIHYTCFAQDPNDKQTNDTQAKGTKETQKALTDSSDDRAKPDNTVPSGIETQQARFMSLLTQMAAMSQEDPNSPKLEELMKQVEAASADLQTSLQNQKKVDLTTLPAVPEKISSADPNSPDATNPSEKISKPEKFSATLDPRLVIESLQKVKPQTVLPSEASETKPPVEAQAEAETETKEADRDTLKPRNNSPEEPNQPVSDDDIVQLKMKDNILDLNLLIEHVGKVMKFNFLFDSEKGITGKIKMQKYGEIRRRDLLPLLESLLSFNGYTMIREDPFIRIVKRDAANKTAQPLIVLGDQVPVLDVGDSVVAQIVEIKHISVADAKNFLKNFADDKTMVPVPKTNTLIITEYAHRMERLLEMLALVDRPGPDIKLEILPLQYIDAQDVSKQISELLKNLNQQTTSTSAAARKPVPKRTARGKKGVRPSTASAGSLSTGKDGPILIVDERTNRIFVIGDEQGILQVKDLLGLLDVPNGPPIHLIPVEVKHVMAEDVGQQIVNLIQDINKDPGTSTARGSKTAKPAKKKSSSQSSRSRRGSKNRGQNSQALKVGDNGPFLHIDERTNRLLVIGSDDQIDQVLDLLSLLDIPPREYEKLILTVYRPEYVEAEEVRRILSDLGIITSSRRSPRQRANQRGQGRNQNDRSRQRNLSSERDRSTRPGDPALLPGEEEAEIRVAVQESNNKLFILATEKQQRDIKDIMDQVDLDAKNAHGAIQIYPLENREPAFVADMLTELLESAYTQTSADTSQRTRIPGVENAPIIVALEDIYAIAVRGSKKQHDDIREIIKILDKRLPSVLVEAILIQVSVSNSIDLGISLKTNAAVTNDPTNPRRVSGISPFSLGAIAQTGNLVTGSGATVAFFDDDTVFATLEALQKEGKSRIVSRPRILVNDNETGTIDSKREEPTTKTTIPRGSDTPIIEFANYVSAGTTLTITPHIGSNKSDALQLEIKLNVDSFDGQGSQNVPPPKSTNSVETWVTVPDGMTMILGGLIREVDSVQIRKVPFFGDLPFFGAAFRSTTRSKDHGILYVFIKAHIVGREGLEEEFQGLKALTDEAKSKLKEAKIKSRQMSIFPSIPDKEFDTQEEHFE